VKFSGPEENTMRCTISRDCVSYSAWSISDTSGHASDAWLCWIRNSRLRISAYRFYPFQSEMLLIILYEILLQMISIMLWVTLFLGLTWNTRGV